MLAHLDLRKLCRCARRQSIQHKRVYAVMRRVFFLGHVEPVFALEKVERLLIYSVDEQLCIVLFPVEQVIEFVPLVVDGAQA